MRKRTVGVILKLFITFLVCSLVARFPLLPGIYYDRSASVKLGYPFSGLKFNKDDRNGYVAFRGSDGTQGFFFTELQGFEFPGTYPDKSFQRGDLNIHLNDISDTPYLGDAFPNAESYVYSGYYQVGKGPRSECIFVDYGGSCFMVVRSTRGKYWQDYGVVDSVGWPFRPYPVNPLSYHYPLFLMLFVPSILAIGVWEGKSKRATQKGDSI